jgi:acyl-CoA synthetase (NDP forming)
MPRGRIPGFHMPEPAVRALSQVVRYAAWKGQPVESPVPFAAVRREDAVLLLGQALGSGRGWLAPDEVRELLSLYGVPTVEQRTVATPEAAGTAARDLGGEVALKVVTPGVLHKADVGGVRLHLRGAAAVSRAAEKMADSVQQSTGVAPGGFLVQRMAVPGVEMLVGVVNDRQFGPTIACGAGGTLVEVLKDVSVRLTPLTRSDAQGMLHELRSFPLLNGYRGSEPANVGALEDVILRIGALVDDHPCIAELDCNPVIATSKGAVVVDARVRIEAPAPRRPLGARR